VNRSVSAGWLGIVAVDAVWARAAGTVNDANTANASNNIAPNRDLVMSYL
jgi:hypothetical protein